MENAGNDPPIPQSVEELWGRGGQPLVPRRYILPYDFNDLMENYNAMQLPMRDPRVCEFCGRRHDAFTDASCMLKNVSAEEKRQN